MYFPTEVPTMYKEQYQALDYIREDVRSYARRYNTNRITGEELESIVEKHHLYIDDLSDNEINYILN